MRGHSLIGAALLSCAMSTAGWAQQMPTLQRVVASGQPQQINFITTMDPDCHLTGSGNFAVLEGPAHGQVSIERGVDFPNYPPNNPRARCNTRKLAGNKLVYQSAPGFVGEDDFVLELVGKYGNVMRARYHIAVR